jgi:hypothetical protein
MPDDMSRYTRRRLTYAVIGLASFVGYAAVVGPLRDKFDDRWPYIFALLAPAGTATWYVCAIAGLCLCISRQRTCPKVYGLTGAGFALIVASGLLSAIVTGWSIAHQVELEELVFQVPWRLFLWKWYFRLGVPQLIAAVGLACIVGGIASVRRSEEGFQKSN